MELNYFILNWILILTAFSLLVSLQAWFINGIFICAEGETEKLPDGTYKDSEMILYSLKKWLTKKREKHIYYRNEEFKNLVTDLRKRFQFSLPDANTFRESEGLFIVFSEKDKSMVNQLMAKLEKDEGLKSDVHQMEANMFGFSFYRTYQFPVYSKWVRKPIIECVKCMASFWGTLTYWPIMLWVFGFEWWQIPVWIVDMIILVYVNYYWYKKTS